MEGIRVTLGFQGVRKPPASKRQRTALADKAREQQDVPSIPANLGSIRVQFVDQATGKPTGGAVSIPVVDATVNNLELLLNSLQGNVCMLPQVLQQQCPSSLIVGRF